MIRYSLAVVAAILAWPALAQTKIIPDDRSRPPFQFADAPVVTAGGVTQGSVLLSGTMRYGYTAVALADFSIKNKWGKYELKAGEELYGVPMGNPGMRAWMIYCAPRVIDNRGWANCVVAGEGLRVTMTSTTMNPYLVQSVSMAMDSSSNGQLAFDFKANSLSKGLKVAIRLDRVSKAKAEFMTIVTKGDVVVGAIREKVKFKNGTAVLSFGTGVIRLVQSGSAVTAEILRAVPAGDSILMQPIKT